MPKDYYIILGVSKGAELNKIKEAYRRAVKKYHPDASHSSESVEKFMEIKEAYETLRNEEKRRRYDEKLAQEKSAFRITQVPSLVRRRASLFDELESFVSRIDEFFSGFIPGFFEKGKERVIEKVLYLDLILSPREAREGGLFSISVPVIETCPQCSKTGYWADFICPQCKGYGRIRAERKFSLSVPPRVKDGTEILLSLEDIGLKGGGLNVTVLIDYSLGEEW